MPRQTTKTPDITKALRFTGRLTENLAELHQDAGGDFVPGILRGSAGNLLAIINALGVADELLAMMEATRR